jgi:predicted  nucleic acid-binding Zn-ribbon protein
MTMDTSVESRIAADVEALRETAASTQALYKEVCALLFFRYGITPTTNKLYQLVRRGSMSVPGEALHAFWKDLREKSRVRIERADLPSALLDSLGELASQWWPQALEAAGQAWEGHRQDLAEQLRAADELAEGLRGKIRELEALVTDAESDVAAANEATSLVTADLAASVEDRQGLQERIRELEGALGQQTATLASARKEFTETLDKLRNDHELAVTRLGASEKRALMEIDAERQATVRLRQELTALQESSGAERAALVKQLGGHQQNEIALSRQVGLLEGQLQELRATARGGPPRDSVVSKVQPVASVEATPVAQASEAAATVRSVKAQKTGSLATSGGPAKKRAPAKKPGTRGR